MDKVRKLKLNVRVGAGVSICIFGRDRDNNRGGEMWLEGCRYRERCWMYVVGGDLLLRSKLQWFFLGQTSHSNLRNSMVFSSVEGFDMYNFVCAIHGGKCMTNLLRRINVMLEIRI